MLKLPRLSRTPTPEDKLCYPHKADVSDHATQTYVEVEWDDASISDTQRTRTDSCTRPLIRCFTVGYLLANTPERVVVSHERQAGDDGEADTYRHTTTIPRGMVRKLTPLKEEV